MRTAREFVEAVENMLGWMPVEPRWKSIRTEAGKVKRKQATDPVLYSFGNLELALALLRKEHKDVTSPVAVFWHVERALKMGEVVIETDDLDDQVTLLIEHLSEHGDPGDWLPRLVRAQGKGRQEVLDEYRRNHVR
jgi:hypothetical protein